MFFSYIPPCSKFLVNDCDIGLIRNDVLNKKQKNICIALNNYDVQLADWYYSKLTNSKRKGTDLKLSENISPGT